MNPVSPARADARLFKRLAAEDASSSSAISVSTRPSRRADLISNFRPLVLDTVRLDDIVRLQDPALKAVVEHLARRSPGGRQASGRPGRVHEVADARRAPDTIGQGIQRMPIARSSSRPTTGRAWKSIRSSITHGKPPVR
jgi:hypothetical protein